MRRGTADAGDLDCGVGPVKHGRELPPCVTDVAGTISSAEDALGFAARGPQEHAVAVALGVARPDPGRVRNRAGGARAQRKAGGGAAANARAREAQGVRALPGLGTDLEVGVSGWRSEDGVLATGVMLERRVTFARWSRRRGWHSQ
jgi:hypothetical protein